MRNDTQLPERSKLGYPMRAYYEVMRETGLRPSTLHRLRTPDDYQPTALYLTIREDADKARYGRELPLSDRARAALDSACPEQGTIFPKFDGRHTLRKAALAAGLDAERASKFSAYDLRHSLATELTERSGNLVGVGYLLGHKHVTTTNHYVHARRRAAESVLSGHRLGHQGVGRLGPPSSGVAQLPEIKGCGREDSNLHECYLTRSLADLAEEKAHEFKGASRSGTPESTHGRPHFSPVVKNRARDLLRAVADGGDVSMAQVHDFARAVIEAPPFQVAQEILQGGSGAFAVRKVLELASMVLSADDAAAQRATGSQRRWG